jgi:LysM repeat protein
MAPPTCFRSLGLTAAAVVLGACESTQQHMNLTVESLTTPPHNMSHADYPFDASGHYVDSWAVQGAARYGSRVNSDRHDTDRTSRKTAKPSARANPTAKSPPTTRKSHTVKPGESLYSISRRYDVSVLALKNANGLKSNLLRAGQRLTIPR